MNNGESEFDPLEASLGSMHRKSAVCPSAGTLAGFAADCLPPDETALIQAHVVACGMCDSLVESLRNFDEPVANAWGWASTERRLRARVFPKTRGWWLLHPAIAYGIALAAIIFAVIPGRRPEPAVAPAKATIAMESVSTIDLEVTRGSTPPHFTVAAGDRFLVLSFLIDIHPIFHYVASLDDGAPRDIVSSDGRGNFAELFSRDLLGSGKHHLKVAEVDPRTGKTERSFEFSFEL